MHDENPQTTEAIRLLRDWGFPGLTVSGAVEILVAKGFRPSNLTAVSIDDAIAWADILRGAGIKNVPRSAA
jgi:hypothetical protein